ncbi:hypothetical protein CRU99_07715 [Malaciobacter mytili]|uniref:hypothetical protein n=1 Tax=Malaciobacter mytili TaxID=603050 RepID=UPI00100ACF2B|nr:hypothetical protein [Malaciobacter mytili]RXI43412.1 hypothetical protein CRU99_07715 [Malaciobacter mytili]
MLAFCIVISMGILFFYMINKYKKDSYEVIFIFSLFCFCLIWTLYFLIDNTRPHIFILIAILLFELLLYIFILSFDEAKDKTKILAKQQNYWDIEADKIIKAFENLKIIKPDRIEVNVKKESLYTLEDNRKVISIKAIEYYKKMQKNYIVIYIKNLDEIKKYPLESLILKKLVFYIEVKKEQFPNYLEILEKFDNRLDFFIMYLWHKYTKNFNIGIGQLEALVVDDENRQELINAIDNINLEKSKLKGSYLEYKYFEFLKERGLNE